MIDSVDEFVFYDDVQYTKKDWRNRNKIKTAAGLLWLTIPVLVKNKFDQRIMDVRVNGSDWEKKHLKSILFYYKKAAYFHELRDFLIDLYETAESPFLNEINYSFLEKICGYLGIHTTFRYSFDYTLDDSDCTGRVVDLCRQLGATHLLNGPKAKHHMNEALFRRAGKAPSGSAPRPYTEADVKLAETELADQSAGIKRLFEKSPLITGSGAPFPARGASS